MKVISTNKLTENDLTFCKDLQVKASVPGVLVGAMYDNHASLYYPIFLENHKIKILKYTAGIKKNEGHILQYLNSSYERIKSLGYVDEDFTYGTFDNQFWIYRNYYKNTLSSYLSENSNLGVREKNSILLKISNTVLDLKRNNIVHGHICENNIIIKDGEVKFVDFALGYCSKREFSISTLDPDISNQTPSFKSDVFGLGCIIKNLYKGIPSPLPYDSIEAMTNVSSSKRPELVVINKEIMEVFSNADSLSSFPKINEGDVLSDISENPNISSELVDVIAGSLKKAKTGNLVFMALLAFIVYGFYSLATQETIIVEGEFEKEILDVKNPKELLYAKKLLDENGINDENLSSILDYISINGYESQKIINFFNGKESKKEFSVKLKALFLMFSEDIESVEYLFDDISKSNKTRKWLSWFSDGLVDWNKIDKSSKVLILLGVLPTSLNDKTAYIDLFKHEDEPIPSKALNLLIGQDSLNKDFYKKLFEIRDSFKRSEIVFLMLALREDNKTEAALLSQWFLNTKPNKQDVLELALVRNPDADKEDMFSFMVARYILPLDTKPDFILLKKLLNHHELLFRAVALSYIDVEDRGERELLLRRLEIEKNKKIIEEIKRKLN